MTYPTPQTSRQMTADHVAARRLTAVAASRQLTAAEAYALAMHSGRAKRIDAAVVRQGGYVVIARG